MSKTLRCYPSKLVELIKRLRNYFKGHPRRIVTLVTASLSLFFSLLTTLWKGALIVAAIIAVTGYIIRGLVKKTLTEKLLTKVTYPREVKGDKYPRLKRLEARLGRGPEVYKVYMGGEIISIRLGYCKWHKIYFESPPPLQCPKCLEEGKIWSKDFKRVVITREDAS